MLTIDRRRGDARDLAFLSDNKIDVIVTSPPYWRRRDYGHPEQLGQEATPGAYIEALISILNNWVRVLRPHASVFLNIGDTYQDGFVGDTSANELTIHTRGSTGNHENEQYSIGRATPATVLGL